MDVHRLDSIFKPKRIAVIGVTINPNSVGGKVLGNLVGGGFAGVVYPVNPQHGTKSPPASATSTMTGKSPSSPRLPTGENARSWASAA